MHEGCGRGAVEGPHVVYSFRVTANEHRDCTESRIFVLPGTQGTP